MAAITTDGLHKLYVGVLERTADNVGFGYWDKIRANDKDGKLTAEKFASFFLQSEEAVSRFGLIKELRDIKTDTLKKTLNENPLATQAEQESAVDQAMVEFIESSLAEDGKVDKFSQQIFKQLTSSTFSDLQKVEIFSEVSRAMRNLKNQDQIFDALATIVTNLTNKYSNSYTQNAVKVSQSIVDQLNSLNIQSSTKIDENGYYNAAHSFKALLSLAHNVGQASKVVGDVTSTNAISRYVSPALDRKNVINLEDLKGSDVVGTPHDDVFVWNSPDAVNNSINGGAGDDTLKMTLSSASTIGTGSSGIFNKISSVETVDINFSTITSATIAGDPDTKDSLIIRGSSLSSISIHSFDNISVDTTATSLSSMTGDPNLKQVLNLDRDTTSITLSDIETINLGANVRSATITGSSGGETLNVAVDATLTLSQIDTLVFGSNVDSISLGTNTNSTSLNVKFGDSNDSVILGIANHTLSGSGNGTFKIEGSATNSTITLSSTADSALTVDTTKITASNSGITLNLNGSSANDSIVLKLGGSATDGSTNISKLVIDLSSGGNDTVDLKSYTALAQLAANSSDNSGASDSLEIKGFSTGDTLMLGGKANAGVTIKTISSGSFSSSVGKDTSTDSWFLYVASDGEDAYLVHEGTKSSSTVYDDDLIIKLVSVDSVLIKSWRDDADKKVSLDANGSFVS